ncbi:MAG: hypothetical protein Q8K86_09020 [Candidatus Nanopelagicaceae bacterium]|nr:hypothetical protein [Candidatus Nanopelagicaceae bacterium]
MANPRYAVGDQVFLKTSAALGFMEPYFISQVMTRGAGWQYMVSIRKKPNQSPTVGDVVDLRYQQPFVIDESDLVDPCDASTLVVNVLRSRLVRAEAVHDSLCEGSGSGST